MAITLGDAVLYLRGDDSNLDSDLGRSESKISGFVSNVGGIITVGLAAGFAALAGGLAYSVAQAMEAEEVQAQLAAVLTSTGGAAGVTADMANGLANSLSGVTRFGDEAILAGESMLLTFTNIGSEVFPAATEALLNLAQTMGGDPQSQAIQLGKALNDPINGVSALTRVGVTFTDEQKKLIKSLQESGDMAGAQTIILKELEKEFGGAAVAAGQTFAGKLDILKNRLSNVAETVGGAVLPILTSLIDSVIAPALPIIEAVGNGVAAMFESFAAGDIGGGFEALADFINGVLPGAGDIFHSLAGGAEQIAWGIGTIVETLGPFITGLSDGSDLLGGIWTVISGLFGPEAANQAMGFFGGLLTAFSTLRDFVVANLPLIQETFTTYFGAIIDIVMGLGGFLSGTLLPALMQIWNAITEGGPSVQEIFTAVMTAIGEGATIAAAFFNDVLLPALTVLVNWIVANLVPAIASLKAWLAENLPPAIQALTDLWTGTLQPALAALREFIVTSLIPAIVEIATWIGENLPPLIQSLADYWTNTLQPALAAIWSFVVTSVIPMLSDVAVWLRDNLPPAIQTVSDFFNNTLLPALDAIWVFVRDNILPVLATLTDVALAALDVALAVIETTWRTLLRPALDALWTFIRDNIVPILESAAKVINENLGPAMDWLNTSVIGPLETAFAGLRDVLSAVAGWLTGIADAIRGLPPLPGALTPGSPTPFEKGLRGIASAARQVVKDLNPLGRMLDRLGRVKLGGFIDPRAGYGKMVAGNRTAGLRYYLDQLLTPGSGGQPMPLPYQGKNRPHPGPGGGPTPQGGPDGGPTFQKVFQLFQTVLPDTAGNAEQSFEWLAAQFGERI